MDPFTVETTIARPREEVFEYLADIANHPEFSDHYLVDWRLTREDSYGQGAGARFKVQGSRNRFPWADVTLTEVDPPRRIVERGRSGKYNRTLTRNEYELTDGPGGGTRVRSTFETKPALLSDRLLEKLGARRRRRNAAKALRRLRSILEEDYGRGRRASVAGGARKPATAYRFR